jgi:hypothetical protein
LTVSIAQIHRESTIACNRASSIESVSHQPKAGSIVDRRYIIRDSTGRTLNPAEQSRRMPKQKVLIVDDEQCGGRSRKPCEAGATCPLKPSLPPMGSGSTAGSAGQLIAINNNSTINGTAESAAFTYDNVGRLVTSNQTSNGSSAQRRFGFDRWGNRTGVWDATSGGNQIQSITLQGSGGIPTNQIQSVTSGGVNRHEEVTH